MGGRSKRQYGGGQFGGGGTFGSIGSIPAIQAGPGTVLLATGFGFQECPACCVPGARGPPGDPGLPGMHGAPGPDGAPGRPGITPNASCVPERIFEPPPCLPCPQGPRGQPGHPGFPGEPGDPGIDGESGKLGLLGNPGPPGVQGLPGPRGPPGPVGDPGYTPEAKVPAHESSRVMHGLGGFEVIPGPPGDAGDPGPWGLPGHPGLTGEGGFPGIPGERGWPGPPGDPGLLGPRGPEGPTGEAGPPGTPGTCVCQETEVVIQDQRQAEYDLNKAARGDQAPGLQPPPPPLEPIVPDYEPGAAPAEQYLPVLDSDPTSFYNNPDYAGLDLDAIYESLGGLEGLGNIDYNAYAANYGDDLTGFGRQQKRRK